MSGKLEKIVYEQNKIEQHEKSTSDRGWFFEQNKKQPTFHSISPRFLILQINT
jgi:hypothetical protein